MTEGTLHQKTAQQGYPQMGNFTATAHKDKPIALLLYFVLNVFLGQLLLHEEVDAEEPLSVVHGTIQIEIGGGRMVPASYIRLELHENKPTNKIEPKKYAGYTGKDGFFSFDSIPSGPYTLSIWISPDQKEPITRDIVVDESPYDPIDDIYLFQSATQGEFSNSKPFRPISLFADPKSGNMFAATGSPNPELFIFSQLSQLFRKIGNLEAQGTTTDVCFVQLSGKSYIIIASHVQLERSWVNFLKMLSLDLGQSLAGEVVELRTLLRPGRYHGIFFDAERKRLLMADPVRDGIFAINISEHGFEDSETQVFQSIKLTEPVTVAIYSDSIFIGDARKGAIYRGTLDGNYVERIFSVGTPQDLNISPDGRRLLVADGRGSLLLEYDLLTDALNTLLNRSNGLKTPTALLVDTGGDIWVADTGAQVVHRFNGQETRVYTARD